MKKALFLRKGSDSAWSPSWNNSCRNDPYLSWRTLKTNLRSYFVPKNEDNRVLDDWRALAQGETKLQEYVEKYRQMMLRTDHLDWETVRLHGFLYGLKEWARREIEKQNPTTYVEALEMTPQPTHATKGKARWDDLVPDSLWMSPKQTERASRQGAQVHCCVMKVQVQNSEEECVVGDRRIIKILESFQDVMPPKLPPGLPPQRDVDHKIELVPGQTPPARPPYRMDGTRLQELRKQLEELLDAGFIQPSKSPYGIGTVFHISQKLSPKQMRWQDQLAEYDIEIIHKPGKHNVMPDALSRMHEINAVSVISSDEILDQIRNASKTDPGVLRMMQNWRQDLDAEEFLANWQKRMEVARRHLVTYKEKYVAKANEKARAEFFQAGDLVLVSSQNINLPANLTPKFNHRYYGPYRIVRDFNNVSYQLELPTNVKIHNVFHVSLLKRFHVDKKFGRHVPLLDKGVNPFEPEIILKHRFVRKYPEFYVKWRGRPMSDCTWVPEDRVIAMDKQLLLRYYNMSELRQMPRI
ncbi:hypothetical protein L7F22_059238 [Adiantum nelumboides]|nr:hypothetical protein [Adiantum nelumboides]